MGRPKTSEDGNPGSHPAVLLLLASLFHARAPARPRQGAAPLISVAIMANINPKALYTACLNGDAAAVSRLLPAGGTPRNLSGQRFQFNTDRITPLMVAAALGHTDIVRMILQRARNTPVDYANARGFTAQIMAAQYHHVDIVRLLADCGANVNLATRRGNTAIHLAVAPFSPDDHPRDPDPDGARQLATVKALLELDAGTSPRPPPRPLLTWTRTNT